jgi:acetyl esterase
MADVTAGGVRRDPALDPDLRAMLERLDAEGRGLGRLPVAEERVAYRALCCELSGPPPAGVSARDLTMTTDPPVRARLYEPASVGGPGPALVFVHGGGGVVGDIEAYDTACRTLVHESGVRVVSIDYRLAPEHPAAAAFADAEAAVRWVHAHAAELGIDPGRLAVGGDSQGGLLAAAAAQACRDLPLGLQLLVYPGLGFDAESAAPYLEGYFLDSTAITAFTTELHAGGGPEILALMPHGKDLRGAAPAYIASAGLDLLASGVPQYVTLLERRDVAVEHETFPSLIHGFLTMGGVSPAAAAAIRRIAQALRDGLDR